MGAKSSTEYGSIALSTEKPSFFQGETLNGTIYLNIVKSYQGTDVIFKMIRHFSIEYCFLLMSVQPNFNQFIRIDMIWNINHGNTGHRRSIRLISNSNRVTILWNSNRVTILWKTLGNSTYTQSEHEADGITDHQSENRHSK